MSKQCSKIVFGERVQHWQCIRAGVIERDGKWFCRQHDPKRNDVSADAEKLWAWDNFSNKPTAYFVARRTEKEIITRRGSPTGYTTRFFVCDLGMVYWLTELDAWRYGVEATQRNIESLKHELQNARTQLGMAKSRVKALEAEGA